VNGLLPVADDPESPAEVVADDDGVAAPTLKGDGAPEGAVKENPEEPAARPARKEFDDVSGLLLEESGVV